MSCLEYYTVQPDMRIQWHTSDALIDHFTKQVTSDSKFILNSAWALCSVHVGLKTGNIH